MRKFFKTRDDKKLCGVCGGLGKYFDIDPTFVRAAFLLAAFVYGSGVLLYFILALVAPYEGEGEQ